MSSTLKSTLRFVDGNLEEIICGTCLSIMACCVMVQILLRYFLSAAAPWAEEVAVYSMIGSVYFGACLAVRDRAHIRVAFIYNMLPPKLRLITVIFADVLWLLFLFLVFSQSFILVKFLFSSVYISPGLGIEQKWPQSIVPLCILLMIARVVQVYWRWIKNGAEGLPI